MNLRYLFTLLLTAVTSMASLADLPFRNHRYDSFKVIPVQSDAIVFYGNSITNMHEWWEAFGSDHHIINRGCSGGFSQELLDNLESVIDGKPAKLFLLIGTNDISSGIPYQTVVANIEKIIRRIQAESPSTEIYIQSILPRATEPQNSNNKAANAMLADLCVKTGTTFIDLWEQLQGIRDYGEWSADGLHLYASGYRVWCKQIEPYVGSESVYKDNYTNIDGGMRNSNGMRISYFGMLPVKSTDVLFVGDEMINSGEWHELLRSDRIKNRGTGWGYGGLSTQQHITDLTAILTGNGNKETPAKIFFYCGTSDKTTATYSTLLTEARKLAPDAKLYVISQIPLSNSRNSSVEIFNTAIKNIAEQQGATYVDIYSALLDENGKTDTESVIDNYLYGRGYVKVANVLAQYLAEEGVNPLSMEEYEKYYTLRSARNSLYKAIDKAESLTFGNATGQYAESCKDALYTAISQAKKALNESVDDINAISEAVKALNAALTGAMESINMPFASTEAEEHLYSICAPLVNDYYSSAAGGVLTGTKSGGNTADCLWKFIERPDGTYNIVNYANGLYIGTATYNNQLTLSAKAPITGWRLSYSNTTGMYTIYNGISCQYNQSGANNNAIICNWYTIGSMPDRDNSGCQFTITEFTSEVAEPMTLTTGWHEIRIANDLNGYVSAGTDYITNAENEYRQNATNYYALKFAGRDESRPSVNYIHITVNGSTYMFTGLCGHGIQENCTSSRESLPTLNPALSANNIERTWAIGKWNDYSNSGDESPYVGKSSGSNNYFFITPVDQSVLDRFDIYKVTFTGVTPAAEVGLDPRIALNIDANRGIRKVYNNGTFFVDKGTTLAYSDFTPDTHNNMSMPEITIDKSSMTITVDYTTAHDPNSSVEIIKTDDNRSLTMYDMQGRQVLSPTSPGIYLIDGKKIKL